MQAYFNGNSSRNLGLCLRCDWSENDNEPNWSCFARLTLKAVKQSDMADGCEAQEREERDSGGDRFYLTTYKTHNFFGLYHHGLDVKVGAIFVNNLW